MQHNKNLTPQEQQNLEEQLSITSREAEIRENMVVFPGPPAASDEALNDAFLKNIMDFEHKWNTQLPTSVGTMLGGFTFLDAQKLTEREAENAIVDFFAALAKNNVSIDRPEMASAKEFYHWLCNDFIKQKINVPVGNGWTANYIYNELVPEGPDAMNFMVKTCVDGLFQLDYDFNPWIFEDGLIVREEDDYLTEVLPVLHRYITAWRDAIRTVVAYQYTLVAGVRVGEALADFTFNVAGTLVREDGRHDEISGSGTARLVYDGCHWSIRSINFPSFKMPTIPLS
jgi:hypothetical protein